MTEIEPRKLSEEEYEMLIEELDEPQPRNRAERRKMAKASRKINRRKKK